MDTSEPKYSLDTLLMVAPSNFSASVLEGEAISPCSTGDAQSALPIACQICNDRATGRHYGAISCDGCKGFFRRTVRKEQLYACRFDKACLIDKDKRNTCRFCRYDKCLKAGMRKQAVQSERDRLYARRTSRNTPLTKGTSVPFSSTTATASTSSATATVTTTTRSSDSSRLNSALLKQVAHSTPRTQQQQQQTTTLLTSNQSIDQLETLKEAETMLLARASAQSPMVGKVPATLTASSLSTDPVLSQEIRRLATLADLADAIKEQLLLLVEWAKTLQPFMDLSVDDQVALLRGYAAEHLLLGVARRSLPYKDVLLLSNHAYIPREHASEIHDVKHVVFNILDDLVAPMRELQLDLVETGCLKALLFFNPNARGLSNKVKVKEARQSFLEAFYEYVSKQRSQKDKVRFGNLLLLLPPLPSMSQQFIEDLQLATLFGRIEFDKLLEELLLAAAPPPGPLLPDGYGSFPSRKMADRRYDNSSATNSSTDVPLR